MTNEFVQTLRRKLRDGSRSEARTFLSNEERFPVLAELDGVPAGPPEYHEERDTLTHAILTTEEMLTQRPDDDLAVFMALVHDIGKALTPSSDLPSHYGHENRGVEPAEEFARRVGFSEDEVAQVGLATKLHMKVHDVPNVNITTVLDMTAEMREVGLGIDRLIAVGRADSLGHRPPASFDAERIREHLETAWRVQEQVRLEDAAEKRGYGPEDIGDNAPRSEVKNWRRQDRAEAVRDQLRT